jgi:signal transduction histidine kinase/CheY-like chemotaxis protein
MEENFSSERLNKFIDVIMKVARGDYSVQIELSEKSDHFDALAAGINMMIDDIRISHETRLENERINLLNVQLLKAKEIAEESDQLKSAFLANMSHEIRTPMNGILGFAELLKEPGLSGDEQQEYISIIQKSGVRMLNIINDIVSISKVESGQMEVSITAIDINDQLEYIHTFFKPEAEKHGLQLFFKKALQGKKPIVKTDKEKIYAILTNLVKNALKFTYKGSIELGYQQKDNYFEFFVRDTGIGIVKDQQQFIFDRFRQGSESLSRNYEGAGLGLSISKAYVEMLGGRIWVESELGNGSIFYFTIPHNADPEEPQVNKNSRMDLQAEKKVNPEVLGINILIAEDDIASAKLLIKSVEVFGGETIVVRTGGEAVDACHNLPNIDLVLMDIKMPDMDGYEATRLIRQFNKDIIIFAQTSYSLTGDHEKALAAGCNDYISKPIDRTSLINLINKHFYDKKAFKSGLS